LPQYLRLAGHVRYVPVGTSGDNQAIAALSLEAGPDRTLTTFVQVANYGDAGVERRLALLADGQLVHAHDLEIPAGGQGAVVFDGLPSASDQRTGKGTGDTALAFSPRNCG